MKRHGLFLRIDEWLISSDWRKQENADVEPRRLQIFGVFLLFISVLNNKLLQMGNGSQSILLTMTQWQMYLAALKLEMLV